MSIKITAGHAAYEREPLNRPFGFKGRYLRGIWQSVVGLESSSGAYASGVSAQNVLWTDAEVFAEHDQSAGNLLMFKLTEFAVSRCLGLEYETPVDLLEQLLPSVYEEGKRLTGHQNLRLTFVLNSLVGLDEAAWKLYALEHGFTTFDEMIPECYRRSLKERHREVACIPLMTYGIPLDEVRMHADQDFFLMKVKLGNDPERDGDQEKMLAWDKARVTGIHSVLKEYDTPYTDTGRIPYYFDLNRRYESKDMLKRLLDHCDKIGALDRIAMIEEPFPESYEVRVNDLGVRIVTDESAHCDLDVAKHAALGYGALALKPVAKTLSMTLKMLEVARIAGLPMFCADLSVGPIQVDWNKCLACRLPTLPGVKIGVMETNGYVTYRNWEKMRSYHPRGFETWTDLRRGGFHLDDDFYARSGGIFEESSHYGGLVFGH